MDFQEFGISLSETGKHRRHRHAILLSGEHDWTIQAAAKICSHCSPEGLVVLGTGEQAGQPHLSERVISQKQTHRYLGSELEGVVFDCHTVFAPDAVGILSGCIKAGGMMILCTPELSEWPKLNNATHSPKKQATSAYITRLVRLLSNSPLVRHFSREKLPESSSVCENKTGPVSLSLKDQRMAIDAIKSIFDRKTHRHVVLESDRGRGKSAALGIAAKELLAAGLNNIVVTGFNKRSVKTLFSHALDNDGKDDDRIRFYPPDLLIHEQPKVDLLLVDEAAVIPLPILEKVLDIFPCIAFASTVHGYEGTGRGFILRFQKILSSHTQNWRHCRLEEPIRWASNDPLEILTNDLLMLNAVTSDIAESQYGPLDYDQFNPHCLIKNEKRLRDVFSVLVEAHYRTQPSDLAHMLDGDNLQIHQLTAKDQTLAVALMAREGNLPDSVLEEIVLNRRRPRNHLLPEVLCSQLGFPEALQMSISRIVRIAVNPKLKGNGYGQNLLEWHTSELEEGGETDIIGASFGLDTHLLSFWNRLGFSLIRVGVKRGRATGSHSGVVVRGLTDRGRKLVNKASDKLCTNLPYQLPLYFQEMDPATLSLIIGLNGGGISVSELDESDLMFLEEFALGRYNPDGIAAALTKMAWTALAKYPEKVMEDGRIFLVKKILQQKIGKSTHSLSEFITSTGKVTGRSKKAAMHELRYVTKVCLMNIYDIPTDIG